MKLVKRLNATKKTPVKRVLDMRAIDKAAKRSIVDQKKLSKQASQLRAQIASS